MAGLQIPSALLTEHFGVPTALAVVAGIYLLTPPLTLALRPAPGR